MEGGIGATISNAHSTFFVLQRALLEKICKRERANVFTMMTMRAYDDEFSFER